MLFFENTKPFLKKSIYTNLFKDKRDQLSNKAINVLDQFSRSKVDSKIFVERWKIVDKDSLKNSIDQLLDYCGKYMNDSFEVVKKSKNSYLEYERNMYVAIKPIVEFIIITLNKDNKEFAKPTTETADNVGYEPFTFFLKGINKSLPHNDSYSALGSLLVRHRTSNDDEQLESKEVIEFMTMDFMDINTKDIKEFK